MDLVDEEDSWDELGDALVDVTVYYFVYLGAEFLGYFGFLWFHYLAHQAHEIVAPLRPRISHIQIM